MKNGCLKNLTCKHDIRIFINDFGYNLNMDFKRIFDKFFSNIIVYASYTLMIFIWYYLFYNSENQTNLLLLYFPYGIILLGFLFFGNKVIIGLLFSYISFYVAIKNYNLYLPFNNFFVMSASQLFCVPITLFVLQKFNITVGAGKKYRLDKTNIYHVLLITFLSTIVLGTLVVFTSIFYENQNGFLKFIIGHFLGGAVLIVSMKLLINLPTIFINFIKSS